jgi:hypothetical protein
MSKKETINVQGSEIIMFSHKKEDYISLTDMAKYRDRENPAQVISLWLRTCSTIEYLGLWERLNSPDFKPHIYEGFKNESAKPHFWMSPTFPWTGGATLGAYCVSATASHYDWAMKKIKAHIKTLNQ